MTAEAIEILSQDEDGFFRFVEEEAIDEMSHANNSELTLEGVIELDQAVGAGVQFAGENDDTLLLVTADHECGGLTIESLDHPEFSDESGVVTGGRADLSSEDGPFPIADSGYEFIMDWTPTGHTAVGVPLTSMGPGAENPTGTYGNTRVFEVLVDAMGQEPPEGIPTTPAPGATPEA